jgi:hypothetical protein
VAGLLCFEICGSAGSSIVQQILKDRFTDRSDCFTAMIVQQSVKNTRCERHEIKALSDSCSAQGCKRFEFLKFRTKPKFEILAIGSGESLKEERLQRAVIADSGVWVSVT